MNSQTLQQKAALFSGIALLIMTLAAFFAYGYAHSALVVNGDATATLANIQDAPSLFRFEILGWFIIIVLDVIVAWGFYLFLKPFHSGFALLAGLLRIFYTVILAIAVSHLVIASGLAQTTASNAIATETMNAITTFEDVWSLGLIIFGLHLVVVGLVTVRTKQIPTIISWLLILAGISYTLVNFLYAFFPQVDAFTALLETVLMVPMFVGEIGFGIWLLVKGRKLTTVA